MHAFVIKNLHTIFLRILTWVFNNSDLCIFLF